ncbi:SDR family oxidoreductase [Pseudalkalibacillus berkeleyi]|uniref:SDR family oxidoreductase n=1 Tax=Pseudalkalibacillus berkeleyi TaxID=1069813 RepID=A0ABS9GU83_9BACL|nr:SDR family oxidoreductase [Pseudalkalibacillus berkeleyi]MCF6136399.1 SDR family oxidoreductase [Pseudalkalibacillus berkeleyi]
MDLQLNGKSVVVTAGSKGLGKATAMEFAKEGAHVIIASRNEEQLSKAKDEIIRESKNEHVDYVICDITNPNQINNLVDLAVERNGTIDVLINNAGGPPAGRFEDMNDEDWQYAFELNLLSFIRLSRKVIPHMKEQQNGRIINFASSSIKQPLDNLILSNTFRAGIVGLAKSLSQELAADQIMVNTIGPGRIATDRVAELDGIRANNMGTPYEEFVQYTEKKIPLQRYGTPEEFAKLVVFLGSGANTYITGQSILVDGGMVKAL